MTRDEIVAFFARRADAWARRDVAALVSDFADDCVVEGPTAGGLRGRAAVEAIYRHWFSAFPDIVFEPHEPLSMDGRAAQVITIHGTDTGGFLGQAPTHKPFRLECVITNEFLDGRILREPRVYDLHGVLMQLAIDPTLGQTPAEKYQTTLERRRMAEELRMAADIQRLLLPHGQHRGDGFEVAATSMPCRAIGGDFFDSHAAYTQHPDDVVSRPERLPDLQRPRRPPPNGGVLAAAGRRARRGQNIRCQGIVIQLRPETGRIGRRSRRLGDARVKECRRLWRV